MTMWKTILIISFLVLLSVALAVYAIYLLYKLVFKKDEGDEDNLGWLAKIIQRAWDGPGHATKN